MRQNPIEYLSELPKVHKISKYTLKVDEKEINEFIEGLQSNTNLNIQQTENNHEWRVNKKRSEYNNNNYNLMNVIDTVDYFEKISENTFKISVENEKKLSQLRDALKEMYWFTYYEEEKEFKISPHHLQ